MAPGNFELTHCRYKTKRILTQSTAAEKHSKSKNELIQSKEARKGNETTGPLGQAQANTAAACPQLLETPELHSLRRGVPVPLQYGSASRALDERQLLVHEIRLLLAQAKGGQQMQGTSQAQQPERELEDRGVDGRQTSHEHLQPADW